MVRDVKLLTMLVVSPPTSKMRVAAGRAEGEDAIESHSVARGAGTVPIVIRIYFRVPGASLVAGLGAAAPMATGTSELPLP